MNKPKSKNKYQIRQIWHKLKRWVLIGSALLFCAAAGLSYGALHEIFSSRSGQTLTWAGHNVLKLTFGTLPGWVWPVGGVVTLWLWWRHKLIMSIIYGVVIGGWLAL